MNALQKSFDVAEADLHSEKLPSSIEAALMPVLEAVKILGPSQFRIGDRPTVSIPSLTRSDPAKPLANRLSEALWPALYEAAYTRPFDAVHRSPFPPSVHIDLLAELRAAFPEGSRWSHQWQVYKAEANGSVHVRKGDCCRHVLPGAYTLTTPSPVQINGVVSILLPLASSQLQAGFYHINSYAAHSDHDDAALSRLYFNSRPDAVTSMMSQVAAVLNEFGVPFRAKTLLDAGAYDRTDSTVFYVARRHMPFVLLLLRDLFANGAPELNPDVPLFTKSLTSGIGAADDPGYGMSFGQTRAMLVADAIVNAWRAGSQSAEARLEQVKQRFAISGLSLHASHLNAGNSDIYNFPAA